MKLNIAIALGLVAGLLLGLAAAITESPVLMALTAGVTPVGTAFVNLLKMVVIPLVTTVVFVGVAVEFGRVRHDVAAAAPLGTVLEPGNHLARSVHAHQAPSRGDDHAVR